MNFYKNILLGLAGLAPFLSLSGCQAPSSKSPELPNIVLIMADDMGTKPLVAMEVLNDTVGNA
jgi:hypothetical protein